MALELHRLTREYVWWLITSPNDLTGVTVEVAFTDELAIPALWDAATLVDVSGTFYIRALVSGTGEGGDIELDPGDYQAWARITDTPERPVRKTGIVTIL